MNKWESPTYHTRLLNCRFIHVPSDILVMLMLNLKGRGMPVKLAGKGSGGSGGTAGH